MSRLERCLDFRGEIGTKQSVLLYTYTVQTTNAHAYTQTDNVCISLSLSLEEGNVEERSVEVDKLEDVHLCNEAVVVVSLSAVKFCSEKIVCYRNINTRFFFVKSTYKKKSKEGAKV